MFTTRKTNYFSVWWQIYIINCLAIRHGATILAPLSHIFEPTKEFSRAVGIRIARRMKTVSPLYHPSLPIGAPCLNAVEHVIRM
jgi:hypothetical protein